MPADSEPCSDEKLAPRAWHSLTRETGKARQQEEQPDRSGWGFMAPGLQVQGRAHRVGGKREGNEDSGLGPHLPVPPANHYQVSCFSRDWVTLCGGLPGHCGLLSSIPGPHPLDARSTSSVTTTDVLRHRQCLLRSGSPWVRPRTSELMVMTLPELEQVLAQGGGSVHSLREAFLEEVVSELRLTMPWS